MPPRLNHKKSRRGCLRCKARKVKCDEKYPSCSWCESHRLPCRYAGRNTDAHEPPLPERPSTHSAGAKTSEHFSGEQSAPDDDDNNPLPTVLLQLESRDRRLFELSLLHYYLIQVAPTYPYIDTERGLRVHQILAVHAALRCSCLLFAIYALATLHVLVETKAGRVDKHDTEFLEIHGIKVEDPSMWTPEGSEADVPLDVATLHYQYFDAAVKGQREALESITEKNADGVCMSAVYIAQMALVQHTQSVMTLGLTTYHFPAHWLQLIRAYTACLETARPFLTPTSVTTLLITPREPFMLRKEELNPIHCDQFPHLIDYVRQPEDGVLDDETMQSYNEACAFLGSSWKAHQRGEPWHGLSKRIHSFLYYMSPHFFKLVEENRPRALVMMAHLFVMAKPLAEGWWLFRNVPQVNIQGIAYRLPEQWQWAMRWPLAMIEREDSMSISTTPARSV